MGLPLEQLERFAADLAADAEHWQRLVRHRDDIRVYEPIWADGEVNAWVICWSWDQDTGFHDHDDSAAAIAVIAGAVREERLRVGSQPQARVLGAGSLFTVPPTAIHRVLHAGVQPAVTIHAYSPPLRRTGSYRIAPSGELQRESLSYEVPLQAEAVSA